MEETLARVVHDVFGRLDGPLHFRILLQPTMAIIFAIRDGLNDARQGRPTFGRFSRSPISGMNCCKTDGDQSPRFSSSQWCWTLSTN